MSLTSSNSVSCVLSKMAATIKKENSIENDAVIKLKLETASIVDNLLSSETIAKFRYDSAGIGNKFPRVNRAVKQVYCPLCPTMVRNTVFHVALFCPAIEKLRKEQTVMTFFRNLCHTKGFSDDYIFELIINGFDWNENPSYLVDFFSRGSDLKLLLDDWLSRW